MNLKIATIAFVASIVLAHTSAWAEKTCVGGTLITTNKYGGNQDKGGYCKADGSDCNGKTFCVSDGSMPWWSYFLWCESNGRSVAKWEDLCPNTPIGVDTHPGACANFAGLYLDLYTPFSASKGTMYAIRSDAQIVIRDKTSYIIRAVCE